tara:strand:- start:285 stop:1172 length:888 start_codon:yes stop_codon:yes gene_type:complete
MKKFIYFISKIIIGLYISAYLIDTAFDYIFTKYSKRNKFNILNNKEYDLALFGNSRIDGNIIPQLIDSTLGISCINVGGAALYPVDILASLRLYIYKNKVPKIIIVQIDDTFNYENSSFLGRQVFLPYYKSNILSDYYNYCEDSKYYRIPLYRYNKYRDLGWRELYKIIINNSNELFQVHSGYRKRDRERVNITNEQISWDYPNKINTHIQSIIDLCERQNIKLIFLTSPVYGRLNQNVCNEFDEKFDNYINQSQLIDDIEYFVDRSHVNHQGAIIQTLHLIEEIKKLGFNQFHN